MATGTIVERWMLERYDREEGMVRVETCRATRQGEEALRAAYLSGSGAGNGAGPGKSESLAWWEAATGTKEMRMREFHKRLGLETDVEMVEGMVLYLFRSGEHLVKVVNATPQARNLSSKLYNTLMGVPDKG